MKNLNAKIVHSANGPYAGKTAEFVNFKKKKKKKGLAFMKISLVVDGG